MNIRDTLKALGIDFRENGESSLVSHGWVGVECPYCGRGTGKHGLGINLKSLACKCWKCGSHQLSVALAAAGGVPRRDVLVLLGNIDERAQSGDDWRSSRPVGTYKPPSGTGELLRAHRKYLTKRGYDPDECSEVWGLQGIGADGGRYRWRLFIPVLFRGTAVSWQTRAIGDGVEPRYLAADPEDETMPLKHCLGGEQHARHSIVVVEGFFQAMRIGPGALATLGVGYTESQLIRIAQYSSRVIVFDNEPEAQRRARKLADDLAPFPGDTFVACLSGPQPDSSPPEEIAELRRRFLE